MYDYNIVCCALRSIGCKVSFTDNRGQCNRLLACVCVYIAYMWWSTQGEFSSYIHTYRHTGLWKQMADKERTFPLDYTTLQGEEEGD